MKAYCLQHVPFEGPGNIARWASTRGHELQVVHLFQHGVLPAVASLDLLIVMGGPMSVHDEAEHPWLVREKKLIADCLLAGKFVVGVCLGSQLLAEALGSRVYRNRFKEIGWFPVRLSPEAQAASLVQSLPPRFDVFHWHGETYDLPPGAIHLANSEGCFVQAFEHPSALGLQFHLESTRESVADLMHNCGREIGSGPYEQTPDQMLGDGARFAGVYGLLFQVLDAVEARVDQFPANL